MQKRIKEMKNALNKPKQIEEILQEQIDTALREHSRSNIDLLLSAISAGLEIGFSVFLMATVYSLFHGVLHPSVLHVLISLAYPLGFIFVIIGKSELFTEHTTMAVLPVLNRNASIKSLLVLWIIIYFGNLTGGYVISSILAFLPAKLDVIQNEAYYQIAKKVIAHEWYIIMGSAILAGWLMGLLSWLVTSSQETISRLIIITLITSVIGIGGLHHCIVGSIEVFTAMLSSKLITLKDYLNVQLWSTIGNLFGGVVFVALLKFSHVNPRNKK